MIKLLPKTEWLQQPAINKTKKPAQRLSFTSGAGDVFVKSTPCAPQKAAAKINFKKLSFLGSTPAHQEVLDKFHKHVAKIEGISAVLTLYRLRKETGQENQRLTPEKRAAIKENLQNRYNELIKSDDFCEMLLTLSDNEVFSQLDKTDQMMVKLWTGVYDEATATNKTESQTERYKITQEDVDLILKANPLWIEARQKNDFSIFVPALEAVIKYITNQATASAGDVPYDKCLQKYEKGMNINQLDDLFKNLRAQIVPIVKQINDIKLEKPEDNQFDFLDKPIKADRMMKFIKTVLTDMGYNFKHGGIYKTEHPVTFPICAPTNVAITIRKTPEEITFAEACDLITDAMHEGGHALLYQGADKRLRKTGMIKPSQAVGEAQARLWEVVIGKGKPFWEHYYPLLQKDFPDVLGDVSLDKFYKAINNVQASPVRVTADELTYNLHIMLRYELEKELMEGKKNLAETIASLPDNWNSKFQEYIGIKPKDNKEGVLQDVHWSYRYVGYFPTYTIGNMLAVMLYDEAKKEIPGLEDKIKQGNLKPLTEWLTKNIYKDGSRESYNELSQRLLGKKVDATDFVDYLKRKFSDIYHLASNFC